MRSILIGAGGHASVVWEIAQERGIIFDAFVDENVDHFRDIEKTNSDYAYEIFFLGIGGVNPEQLEKRHSLYTKICTKGLTSIMLQSNQSCVSQSAHVETGTLIAHCAVVQIGAVIQSNCIINTGAIIEHDAVIENGCHIAPGAIILGGAKVGHCSMIGAGAVVLPHQVVPPYTLVPSLTRFKT